MEHCWHVEHLVSLAGKSLCKYSTKNTEGKGNEATRKAEGKKEAMIEIPMPARGGLSCTSCK